MERSHFLTIFALLACASLVSGQSVDGCSKNCAQCWKNPSPPAGQIQKSCLMCLNSAPKVTSTAGYFDCSGTAIPNCNQHIIDTTTLKVSCVVCQEGYMKQTSATGDSCVTLNTDFPLCRIGNNITGVEACLLCQSNHGVEISGTSSQQSRACAAVPSASLINNCDDYSYSGPPSLINYKCRTCKPGFILSSAGDSCTAMTSEQIPCARGAATISNVISCETCNLRSGYMSIDSISNTGDTPITAQRQICKKSGSILLIIIIVIIALVIIVSSIIILKKRKERDEGKLKGSMLGGY